MGAIRFVSGRAQTCVNCAPLTRLSRRHSTLAPQRVRRLAPKQSPPARCCYRVVLQQHHRCIIGLLEPLTCGGTILKFQIKIQGNLEITAWTRRQMESKLSRSLERCGFKKARATVRAIARHRLKATMGRQMGSEGEGVNCCQTPSCEINSTS